MNSRNIVRELKKYISNPIDKHQSLLITSKLAVIIPRVQVWVKELIGQIKTQYNVIQTCAQILKRSLQICTFCKNLQNIPFYLLDLLTKESATKIFVKVMIAQW